MAYIGILHDINMAHFSDTTKTNLKPMENHYMDANHTYKTYTKRFKIRSRHNHRIEQKSNILNYITDPAIK